MINYSKHLEPSFSFNENSSLATNLEFSISPTSPNLSLNTNTNSKSNNLISNDPLTNLSADSTTNKTIQTHYSTNSIDYKSLDKALKNGHITDRKSNISKKTSKPLRYIYSFFVLNAIVLPRTICPRGISESLESK